MSATTTPSMTHFHRSLHDAVETFEALKPHEATLLAAADMLEKTFLAGNKLLICGNGGSASDAAHISTEFVARFKGDRRPYPALALNTDAGLITAISNDYAYQEVFARQVKAFGQKGDVLLIISSSGKSRNLLDAIEEARRADVRTIALLGRQGGFTKGAAEIEIIVEGGETARIQEAQKFLLHVLCELLEERLPKE
ncbi:MAG: SIS domain-containing protein [Terrimicrobiaceae bacterium]|nr:SIS domain-containing protein [Terrimicrobiaceae bacterium]